MLILPPDSKNHLIASLIKSALRIAAGASLATGFIISAGVLLVIAEVVGVIEELV